MSDHGNPCWYELGTDDLAKAGKFYARILGWNVADAGMEGGARLARLDRA